MKQDVKDGLRASFLAGVISFVGVVIISTLAYFVSSIYSAIFSAFSLTFLVMLISVCVTANKSQQTVLERNIELTAVLYWPLAASMVFWYFLQKYCFQEMSWNKRQWTSWSIGSLLPWAVSAIILISLDYNVPSFHARYNTSEEVSEK
jgi:hypothetical protein